jgi:hypothetical protein
MKNLTSILTAALMIGFITLVVSVLIHSQITAIVASGLIIGSITVNGVRNLIAKA